MAELSILIPARSEMFLAKTVENILDNIEGDTEIIVVADGCWPNPVIKDNPRIKMIHHTVPVGQRAATNDAAKLSRAKYIMKADAHCAFDKGFDVKMMSNIDYDWTAIPRMYNLYAFDWVCPDGHKRYQSPAGPCTECGKPTTMDVVWKPRLSRKTDFARFDKDLHFQYWNKGKTCNQCGKSTSRKTIECEVCQGLEFTNYDSYERRPESKGDIADTMSHVGACWMMHRERYWELGGMDEAHGSWGQMGTEVSCKTWLSGGRQAVNKTTWFSHMFRTQGKDFGFPYPLPQGEVEIARERSRQLWLGNSWKGSVKPLSWLIDKFAPVPEWHEEAA